SSCWAKTRSGRTSTPSRTSPCSPCTPAAAASLRRKGELGLPFEGSCPRRGLRGGVHAPAIIPCPHPSGFASLTHLPSKGRQDGGRTPFAPAAEALPAKTHPHKGV